VGAHSGLGLQETRNSALGIAIENIRNLRGVANGAENRSSQEIVEQSTVLHDVFLEQPITMTWSEQD
jgi:hypothetical protein